MKNRTNDGLPSPEGKSTETLIKGIALYPPEEVKFSDGVLYNYGGFLCDTKFSQHLLWVPAFQQKLNNNEVTLLKSFFYHGTRKSHLLGIQKEGLKAFAERRSHNGRNIYFTPDLISSAAHTQNQGPRDTLRKKTNTLENDPAVLLAININDPIIEKLIQPYLSKLMFIDNQKTRPQSYSSYLMERKKDFEITNQVRGSHYSDAGGHPLGDIMIPPDQIYIIEAIPFQNKADVVMKKLV